MALQSQLALCVIEGELQTGMKHVHQRVYNIWVHAYVWGKYGLQ